MFQYAVLYFGFRFFGLVVSSPIVTSLVIFLRAAVDAVKGALEDTWAKPRLGQSYMLL